MAKVYGNIDIRGNSKLRLYEASGNGSNFVGIKAPAALSADIDFILPSADVASGAVVSDGSGNLSIALLLNANIGAAAAIALTKLAATTASRALASDASGFIVPSATTSAELGFVSGVTSAIQTQLNAKLNLSGGTMSGNIAMGTNKITGLGDPTAAQDAVTKNYVDNAINGLSWKMPANAATTANITLSGTQTIDGVSVTAGMRVLVKNQTTTADNGIYVAAAGAWSRSSDMDSLSPLDEVNGAAIFVLEGTANADKGFVQTATVTTLGSDPIAFAQFSAAGSFVGGNGISISGSTIAINLASNPGLQFTSNALDLFLDGSTLSKSASGVKVADSGITNTQVAAAAAIALTKLAATTASRALASDGSGFIVPSATTSTELGYVSGVTSAIQTQIDSKASKAGDTFTGDVILDNAKALKFREATGNGTNYASLQAAASMAADNAYTLPNAFPASSGYVLASTTAGVMSWAAQSTVASFKATWTTGTTKNVNHALASTDVIVQIFDINTGETIEVDTAIRTDANNVDLTSSQAPTGSGWRVLIVSV